MVIVSKREGMKMVKGGEEKEERRRRRKKESVGFLGENEGESEK